MPIATECPVCSTKGQVPDSYSGKRVKCPQCSNLFVVGGGSGSSSGSGSGKAGTNNGTFQRAGAKTQPEMMLPPSPGAKPSNGLSPSTPIKKPGSSYQGTIKPTAGSHPGTIKPTAGSHPGTIKPTAGSHPGTIKPTAGSHAGTQRSTGGSHAGNTRPTGNSHPGAPARKSPSQPEVDVHPPGNVPAVLLGLGGILLGIAGLTLGLIPDLEFLAWPISGFGMLLALGGLGFGVLRFRGFGFPITGALTSGGALCMALLLPASPEEQKKKNEEHADNRGTSSSTKTESPPTKANDTKPASKPPTKPFMPLPPMEEWVDASKGFARIGDVRVRLTGVEVGPVKSKDGRVVPMMEKQLIIRLQIENGSVGQKLNYKGAADPGTRSGDATPQVLDSAGAAYKPAAKGPALPGQVAAATVNPFMSINDLLIFPPPPEPTQFLRLELPGRQFGAAGKVKFQIPGSMIVRSAPNSPLTLVGSIDALRQALKSQDRNARLNALTKLGDAGTKAAPAVSDLIHVLKDPDPALREAAALALGKLGPTARTAVQDLAAALKDAQPKVRAQAAQSLGQLGSDAQAAVGALIVAFADTDADVADKAFQAVKRIEGPAKK